MKTTIQYSDQASREAGLSANQDKYLIEEQNITEGNFLIFSDTKPIEIELAELQQNTLILMDALATAFEEILALKEAMTGGAV